MNDVDDTNELSKAERRTVESLGDGSPSGHDGEADPASGGAPEKPEPTHDDETPVENPSG